MLAVELYLDPDSEQRVRSVWAALDESGVASLGSAPAADYRPHVSLAVIADMEIPALTAALTPVLATCEGLALTLASLGFFPGPESVAFLGVTPTVRLLETHQQVHAALGEVSADPWPIYEPSSFVPHCTLAMDVSDWVAVRAALASAQLPVLATAGEAHVVEISTGRSCARLA
jgi:2'-5' RNA ligase